MAKTCILVLVMLSAWVSAAQKEMDLSQWKNTVPCEGLIIDTIYMIQDPDKPIGMIRAGMNNILKPLYIKKPVEGSLAEMFMSTNNGEHVNLKINKLRIAERANSTAEFAYCALHFELLRWNNGDLERIWEYGETINSKGMEVTGHHDKNLVEAFKHGLVAYRNGIGVGLTQPVKIDVVDSQKKSGSEDLNLPLLENKNLPDGVFRDVQGMKYAQVDTSVHFELADKAPLGDMIVYKPRFHVKQESDPIALIKENVLYYYIGKRYVKMRLDDEGYYAYIEFMEGSSNAVAIGIGANFGLIGGLVASGSYSENVTKRYDLDLLTGDLIPSEILGNRGPTFDVVLQHSPYSKVDTMCISADGTHQSCLTKGKHFVFKQPLTRANVQFEFSHGDKKYGQLVLPISGADEEFVLLKIKKKDVFVADKLNVQMKAAMMRDLKDSDEVQLMSEH